MIRRQKPVSAMTVLEKRARLEQLWVELRFRSYGDGEEGFIRFCAELYNVRSKMDPSGRCKFALYPFQEDLARAYFRDKRHVILKSRQLGATTLAMCYSLWLCIYRPGGANILVVNKSQVDARSNLDQIAFALSFFPGWFKERMPEVIAQSNDRIVFQRQDGSTSAIEAMVATERSGASRTSDLVIADEAALYQNPEATFRSLTPTTDAAAAAPGKGAVMIVFSTARGGQDYFATLWKDAKAGKNAYTAHFVSWKDNPLSNPAALEGGVDRSIVNERLREFVNTPHLFYQEYPETPEEAFMASGASRFPNLPSTMEFDEFEFRGAIDILGTHSKWRDDPTGHFHLAFDPRDPQGWNQNVPVFIGADSALGVGGDYSVAYAVQWDGLGPMQILGYYSCNTVSPTEFADELLAMGWYFSGVFQPAMIAVEVNISGGGGGQSVVGRLRDQGYTNLFRYVQPARAGRKALNLFGVPATRSVKPIIVTTLADWLVYDEALGEEGTADGLALQSIPSRLRDELGTYVVAANGTTNAEPGSNDDHVIAAACAVYAAATNVKRPATKRNSKELASEPQSFALDLSEFRRDIERRQAQAKRQQLKDKRTFERRMRRRR